MKYRPLGRTGVQVSALRLGTMVFGAWGNTDHDDSVHRALDAGVNLVDTADLHGHGDAERIVGKALAGRRDDVVLASKFHNPMGEDVNTRGNSRRWIVRAVEHELVEAQWAAQRHGLGRFVTEQPPYSIFARGVGPTAMVAAANNSLAIAYRDKSDLRASAHHYAVARAECRRLGSEINAATVEPRRRAECRRRVGGHRRHHLRTVQRRYRHAQARTRRTGPASILATPTSWSANSPPPGIRANHTHGPHPMSRSTTVRSCERPPATTG